MLEDILNGFEKSNFILITDEVESCGRALLVNFVLGSLKRHPRVVIACLERPPQFFKSLLPLDVQSNVEWIEPKSYHPDEQSHVLNNVLTVVGHSDHQTIVVLDSLSTSILHNDTPTVCQALHRIKGANHVSQVIALLHRDVHDEGTQRLLKHQASSVLELSQGRQGSQTCHIRHCRQTGKVLKSVESFRFDDNFSIEKIQPFDNSDHSKVSEPGQVDPTSQLTFNLSLTSSEKEARSQVVLPYLKDGSKEEHLSSGRIHYQADEMDDLDEEDPDDDLNI